MSPSGWKVVGCDVGGNHVLVPEDGAATRDLGHVCCGFGIGFRTVTPLIKIDARRRFYML